MKLAIFSENLNFRKMVEDALTSTPHNFESLPLDGILGRGRMDGFDALLVDFQSWQRSAALFRYFGLLEVINRKPVIVFQKGKLKKAPALKLRNTRIHTGFCPIPVQTEELYLALQQMGTSHSLAA